MGDPIKPTSGTLDKDWVESVVRSRLAKILKDELRIEVVGGGTPYNKDINVFFGDTLVCSNSFWVDD